MLFFNGDLPDRCRNCCYCHEPYAATIEHFGRHRLARSGLATVCRPCANQDRALRWRLARENPRPDACPSCGERAV